MYALVINGSWTATPDSALYLSLGESLARGGGFVFNGEPHTFVPPGYPFMLAVAAKLWGANFITYRALAAVTGFLTGVLGYLLIRRICGRDTALAVGGVFALNHVLLHNSTLTLADAPFALWTMIALHATVTSGRMKPGIPAVLIAGLTFGLLPLIRINGLGAPIAAAVFLFSAWSDRPGKRRIIWIALFLLIAFAPFGLWQAWKTTVPRSFGEADYVTMVTGRSLAGYVDLLRTALWGYFAETNYFISGLVIRTGFVELLLPAGAIFGGALAFLRGDRLFVPLAAIQYCGLMLSPAGSRYLIFLGPALYLFTALGLYEVCRRLRTRFTGFPDPRKVTIGFFIAFGLLNAAHDLKSVVRARSYLEWNGPQSERSLPFFEAARVLRRQPRDRAVLTTRHRIVHYLSGARTVPLMRSGVAEHDLWVDDPELVLELTRKRNVGFLFADFKDRALYDRVIAALEGAGYAVTEIPGATSSVRYRLYRIADKGQGA